MLRNFQLGAIVGSGRQQRLLRLPLHQSLQETLANDWALQLEAFCGDIRRIPFNAGYKPEDHECFVLGEFIAPSWLVNETSQTVDSLDPLPQGDSPSSQIKGVVGFARDPRNGEVILFQHSSRSHVIEPGRFLLLTSGTYRSMSAPALTLDKRLSAVYLPAHRKLLFRNFRLVNTFLPLADYYEEASEQEIRDVLSHERLDPEDPDVLATTSNQWFRKRFAMLRDSRILDQFSAAQIKARSRGCDVDVQVSKGRIIFPADRAAAKKLLQFLNEELFRGPITETLYETNSKRRADA